MVMPNDAVISLFLVLLGMAIIPITTIASVCYTDDNIITSGFCVAFASFGLALYFGRGFVYKMLS